MFCDISAWMDGSTDGAKNIYPPQYGDTTLTYATVQRYSAPIAPVWIYITPKRRYPHPFFVRLLCRTPMVVFRVATVSVPVAVFMYGRGGHFTVMMIRRPAILVPAFTHYRGL